MTIKHFTFTADNFIGYLAIYLLLLFKLGSFFSTHVTGLTSVVLICILFVLYNKRKCKIESAKIRCAFILILFQYFTFTIQGFPDAKFLISNFLEILTAILIVSIFSRSKFLYIVSDLVLISCLVSLIAWIISYIAPSALKIFPSFPNSPIRFMIFANLHQDFLQSGLAHRIQGFFFEPGVMQIFLIISIIINYYREYKKINEKKFRTIIYFFTLCLTFSTTGILCGVIVLMLLIVKKYEKISRFLIVCYIAFIPIVYIYMSTRTEGYLQYALYGKVNDVVNYEEGDDNTSSVRVEAVLFPLNHILNQPFVGMSISEKKAMESSVGHSMLTCTPLNYFAFYGVFCGIFCFYYLYRSIYPQNKSKKEILIIVISILISLSSESVAFGAVINSFMFYGVYKNKKFKRLMNRYG